MKKYLTYIFILLMIIFLNFTIIPVNLLHSQGYTNDSPATQGKTNAVTLPNPLDPTNKDPNASNPNVLIGKIINAVLGIVGSLALIMFIYGGFTWMLAAGNQEKVQKGKDILIWATIGLIVIFSAYALVKFVFTGLGVT